MAAILRMVAAAFLVNDWPQIILAVSTLVTSIGAVIIGLRNGAKSEKRSHVTNARIDEVHELTNGMSKRNESIAKALGVEQGKAEEKANPTL